MHTVETNFLEHVGELVSLYEERRIETPKFKHSHHFGSQYTFVPVKKDKLTTTWPSLFAWTYQPGLSAMVQCFSLTIKLHQSAYQPQKPSLGARARNMESPCVGVSDHQLVNLYLHVWPGWCARRTQGFILVWAECPYVQSAAAHVTGTSL